MEELTPVSRKVNSTTIHVSLTPKNGPHLHLPFRLSRKKFKDLSMAEFLYSYLNILSAQPSPQQTLVTQHLMSLMRLASKYDWDAVLFFHAAMLDRIQSGLASWCDFSEIERFNITESKRLQAKRATPPTLNAAGVRNNNGRP